MSRTSSADMLTTKVPRRGSSSSSPSARSNLNASRTGPRLIASCSAIFASTRCSPCRNPPDKICSRMRSAASSASERGAVSGVRVVPSSILGAYRPVDSRPTTRAFLTHLRLAAGALHGVVHLRDVQGHGEEPDLGLIRGRVGLRLDLVLEHVQHRESQLNPRQWTHPGRVAVANGLGGHLDRFRVGCPEDDDDALGTALLDDPLDQRLVIGVHRARGRSDEALRARLDHLGAGAARHGGDRLAGNAVTFAERDHSHALKLHLSSHLLPRLVRVRHVACFRWSGTGGPTAGAPPSSRSIAASIWSGVVPLLVSRSTSTPSRIVRYAGNPATRRSRHTLRLSGAFTDRNRTRSP